MTKHEARTIKTCFDVFVVEELDWPTLSPDLNHMEHLWVEVEQTLLAMPSRPTSVHDLINAVQNEWVHVPTETLQNLLESLPRRVEADEAKRGTNSILKCLNIVSFQML